MTLRDTYAAAMALPAAERGAWFKEQTGYSINTARKNLSGKGPTERMPSTWRTLERRDADANRYGAPEVNRPWRLRVQEEEARRAKRAHEARERGTLPALPHKYAVQGAEVRHGPANESHHVATYETFAEALIYAQQSKVPPSCWVLYPTADGKWAFDAKDKSPKKGPGVRMEEDEEEEERENEREDDEEEDVPEEVRESIREWQEYYGMDWPFPGVDPASDQGDALWHEYEANGMRHVAQSAVGPVQLHEDEPEEEPEEEEDKPAPAPRKSKRKSNSKRKSKRKSKSRKSKGSA